MGGGLLLLALGLAGCPSARIYDSGDSGGGGTCCAFACDDGTSGTVSFTTSDSDCQSYADDQCALAGSTTSSADYEDSGC